MLELSGRNHELAAVASRHLGTMEDHFAGLFREAQKRGEISAEHDPQILARRYQSDFMGLRISAEREGVDAMAIAGEIAEGLARL